MSNPTKVSEFATQITQQFNKAATDAMNAATIAVEVDIRQPINKQAFVPAPGAPAPTPATAGPPAGAPPAGAPPMPPPGAGAPPAGAPPAGEIVQDPQSGMLVNTSTGEVMDPNTQQVIGVIDPQTGEIMPAGGPMPPAGGAPMGADPAAAQADAEKMEMMAQIETLTNQVKTQGDQIMRLTTVLEGPDTPPGA